MKSEILNSRNSLEIKLILNLLTFLRVKSRYIYNVDHSSALRTHKTKYLSSDRPTAYYRILRDWRVILWLVNLYEK